MIRDGIRTWLNIRVRRESAAMGPRPRIHSKLTLGGMRMLVTSRPSDELWHFLSLQGWREIAHRRDRRRYMDLPRVSFDLLSHGSRGEREIRYRQLLATALREHPEAGKRLPAFPAPSTFDLTRRR